MALERGARPLAQCLRCTRHDRIALARRCFSISSTACDLQTQQNSKFDALTPELVANPRLERKLMREKKLVPVGSRRRRAAIKSSLQVPFSQLPYQCFQEARKVLQDDRLEKLEDIRVQRERIERLSDTVPVAEDEVRQKSHRLMSMRHRLEELKILADINDPLVKKRFEDGQGDMSKPVYQHLADKEWRSYKRPLLMQRITQMNVTPDVLPAIEPIVSTNLQFITPLGKRKSIQHGDFVPSLLSEQAPTLKIQPYRRGERLVTIAVVTPDVPNVAKDAFDYRLHFLACNVPISPIRTLVKFAELDLEKQVVVPWLPAYGQKGAPYQRMSIFILEQPPSMMVPAGSGAVAPSKSLDVAAIKQDGKSSKRDNFILRGFVAKHALNPVGVDLFRTKWDEGTASVMRRAGIPGADVEFKRKRIEPLPYKRLKGERFR